MPGPLAFIFLLSTLLLPIQVLLASGNSTRQGYIQVAGSLTPILLITMTKFKSNLYLAKSRLQIGSEDLKEKF